MHGDPARGELLFDDTGEWIGPSTTPESFSALRLGSKGPLSLGGDRSECALQRTSIHGGWFNATLVFTGPRLTRVELFALRPDDGKSWADWSESKEFARKAWQEDWAARVLGVPLTPKPLSSSEEGRTFIPQWGERTPMHAIHPWGSVGSYYDSKGGSAFLVIEYGPPQK